MLSFLQWILIYTLLESIILIILINISKQKLQMSNSVQKVRERVYLMFLVGLLIYIVPQGLKLFLSKYSYPNPDTYNYVLCVEKSIPWDNMPIDPYYRGFPIYIIWGSTLSLLLGTDAHNAFAVLQIISSLLILILMPIMLRVLNSQVRVTSLPLALYPLIPIASIYLYSYMMIMIPQSIGIAVLLLMLTLTFKYTRKMEKLIVYVMLIPISLVHFAVVPTYIFILAMFTFLRIAVQRSFTQVRGIALLIVLPLLLHFIYTAYAYNPADLRKYIEYYVQLWISILTQPEKAFGSIVTTTVTGFPRSYPYINALGPALFISLMLVGAYITLKNLARFNTALLSMAVVGTLYLALGVSRLYYAVWIPSASIARYINVYGFLLISVFNVYTLAQLLDREDKYIKAALVAMSALGLIGAMLDPFTFQKGFEPIESPAKIAELLPEYTVVNFVSSKDLYYMGPAISMWLQLNNKNANIDLLNNLQLNNNVPNKIFSSEFVEVLGNYKEAMVILIGRS